jgi:uncharacterized membrane protein HdeD (DUF308 family)
MSDDDDLAAFEESERRRKRRIARWAAVFWGVLAILMMLVAGYHPALTWGALIALLIAAMYASGRSFADLIGR